MNDDIDLEKIAKLIGQTNDGFLSAKLAIEEIIGKQKLSALVDYYIKEGMYGNPHSELARLILWFLHPQSAMDRYYEIYKNDDDLERRRSAVELLRVVADRRGIKWIREFLDDPDEGIQNWGVAMLDQLLFGAGVDHEYKGIPELLSYSKNHKNAHVRETYERIKDRLKREGVDI